MEKCNNCDLHYHFAKKKTLAAVRQWRIFHFILECICHRSGNNRTQKNFFIFLFFNLRFHCHAKKQILSRTIIYFQPRIRVPQIYCFDRPKFMKDTTLFRLVGHIAQVSVSEAQEYAWLSYYHVQQKDWLSPDEMFLYNVAVKWISIIWNYWQNICKNKVIILTKLAVNF